MAAADPILTRIRAICLGLPNTKETPTWGEPHFRVGDKIFAGYGEDKQRGKVALGFKLEPGHAKAIVREERFWPAPYVGHKGWVSMDVSGVKDWDEVAALVLESYRLIAPKRLVAELDAEMRVGAGTVKAGRRKKVGKKVRARG